jgi:hypothetical protein
VRVGVQHARPLGTGEVQQGQQHAGLVPLVSRAGGDDLRQRGAVEPFRDDHLGRAGHHPGDGDVGVARVRGGELPLRVGLEPVVELLDHPCLELGDQRLDVHAREEGGEQAGEAGQLVEVGHQRGRRAGVLDLHRDVAAVPPGRAVHLADAGRGRRLVVEVLEAGPPGAPELLGQHRVDGAHSHRRRLLLQLDQRLAIGRGDLLGHGRLEHRQRLAELHRPALELPQHREQLLGGALLQLRGDGVGGAAGEPLAQAQRGASGGPQGE